MKWVSWKENFYRSFSCMSGFIWCSPYESIRILSVTMSTFLEQNLQTKAPSNQGIRSFESILVLCCIDFCFSTSLITFKKIIKDCSKDQNLKFVDFFFSTKIYHKFIVTTLCTVGWNVRFLLSSKGLDLVTMRKCYILHNPEICLVSMSSTFTLKKHTNFAATGLCFTWRKFIFLTTKTVHNFRTQLFMIAHYLVWSENYSFIYCLLV